MAFRKAERQGRCGTLFGGFLASIMFEFLTHMRSEIAMKVSAWFRDGGRWCWRAVRVTCGRLVRKVAVASSLVWHDRHSVTRGRAGQQAVLYAFYDLAVSPATFDIVPFLALAKIASVSAKCRGLHVVIVPGTREGFRHDGSTAYDTDAKRWRLRNILVPCCSLIPALDAVTVCYSREEAKSMLLTLADHIFPMDYTVGRPVARYSWCHVADVSPQSSAIALLRAGPSAVRYVEDWLSARAEGRKVVTITLRECEYEEERNSHLSDWVAFLSTLDRKEYFPVVVRDIERAMEPVPAALEGISIFQAIPWHMELRMALYEVSYLNMLVCQGPSILCFLNRKVRYLIFMRTAPGGAVSERYLKSIGIVPGEQLGLASPFQRLVWDDDNYGAISDAFERMDADIHAASS